MGYDPSECKVRVEAGEEVGSRGRKGSVVEKWGVAFFGGKILYICGHVSWLILDHVSISPHAFSISL
jgi:hypothetical protein